MDLQVHVGWAELSKVIIPYFRSTHETKPSACFWTSTLNKNDISAWIDYLRTCDWNRHSGENNYVHLLDVHKSARILHVLSDEAWDKLPRTRSKGGFEYIDWKRIAQFYDGVHLDYPCHLNYLGWDAESTVWFRWCFTEAIIVGRLEGWRINDSIYSR